MADFALLFDAPSRAWAEHVAQLVQEGLGQRGSVDVGLPAESLPGSPASPGYVVTGIAVCDEPEDAMLELILAQLDDYEVAVDASGATTQITVRPII